MIDTVFPSNQNAVALRAELKAWEQQFALAHDGRKATREEIKGDIAIALKYKEYQRTKHGEARTPAYELRGSSQPSRQHTTQITARTVTPLKRKTSPAAKLSESSPSAVSARQITKSADTTPRASRTYIGPTPQKDGRVLGLFDLMSPVKIISPKRSELGESMLRREALAPIMSNAAPNTPTRSLVYKAAPLLEPGSNAETHNGHSSAIGAGAGRHERTPQSESRTRLLSTYLTPSKRKLVCADELEHMATPASKRRDLGFSTPAFLRRDSQGASFDVRACQDEGSPTSRSFTQPKRPGLGAMGGKVRSLSSMIARMRKNEDQAFDDELDILHEIEGGTRNPVLGRDALSRERPPNESEICVPETQAMPETFLGPDGERGDDVDSADEVMRTAPTIRPWKKKGLKRQTKRVMMRPQGRTRASEDSISIPVLHGEGNEVVSHGVERSPKHGSDASIVVNHGQTNATDHKDQSVVKKVVKKVNEAAHMNFRRLKIKSKGGGGGKGRFGRGRR